MTQFKKRKPDPEWARRDIQAGHHAATVASGRITLKVDKEGRLCAWLGSVQSRLHYDRFNKLVCLNEPALCRLTGADKELAMSKIPAKYHAHLESGSSIVMTRGEAFL